MVDKHGAFVSEGSINMPLKALLTCLHPKPRGGEISLTQCVLSGLA
jgi:hypothetical protein